MRPLLAALLLSACLDPALDGEQPSPGTVDEGPWLYEGHLVGDAVGDDEPSLRIGDQRVDLEEQSWAQELYLGPTAQVDAVQNGYLRTAATCGRSHELVFPHGHDPAFPYGYWDITVSGIDDLSEVWGFVELFTGDRTMTNQVGGNEIRIEGVDYEEGEVDDYLWQHGERYVVHLYSKGLDSWTHYGRAEGTIDLANPPEAVEVFVELEPTAYEPVTVLPNLDVDPSTLYIHPIPANETIYAMSPGYDGPPADTLTVDVPRGFDLLLWAWGLPACGGTGWSWQRVEVVDGVAEAGPWLRPASVNWTAEGFSIEPPIEDARGVFRDWGMSAPRWFGEWEGACLPDEVRLPLDRGDWAPEQIQAWVYDGHRTSHCRVE